MQMEARFAWQVATQCIQFLAIFCHSRSGHTQTSRTKRQKNITDNKEKKTETQANDSTVGSSALIDLSKSTQEYLFKCISAEIGTAVSKLCTSS